MATDKKVNPVLASAATGYPGHLLSQKTTDPLAMYVAKTIQGFHKSNKRPDGKTVNAIIKALDQGVADLYATITSITEAFSEELKAENLY